MRRIVCFGLLALACDDASKERPRPTDTAAKSEPAVEESGADTKVETPAKPARFGKVAQPKVSKICETARGSFGYGAECIETELPELETAAGKLVRVVRKGDATARWLYVLAKPDGTFFLGDGGGNGTILDEITKSIDVATTPPAELAQLFAALYTEAAVVRCLPGANDTLPTKDGKPLACSEPALQKEGAKTYLVFMLEQFPHPRLLNRDKHWLYREKIEVREHELSSFEGEGVVELPVDAPLPKDAPPLPTMTTPPAFVAAPSEASAEQSAALCKAASDKLSGIAGRQCKAYAYPSLDLPTGSLFYLANDAGQGNVLALKKPDGTIVVGFELENEEDPIVPIVKSYDPVAVPPAKLVAAHMFLRGEAVNILCLPGSGDVLPDDECTPPSVEKTSDGLRVRAIVEELPLPDANGFVNDPAVRSFTLDLTPGGGLSGGGVRLIDMREE
ncbi:MAG TPA: hypothetical protein VG755_38445 [Nannocystaceae bacterium]|nr:hypothetical protein [Nannocystaceae bacterium]